MALVVPDRIVVKCIIRFDAVVRRRKKHILLVTTLLDPVKPTPRSNSSPSMPGAGTWNWPCAISRPPWVME